MKRLLKRIALGIAVVLLIVLAAGGIFASVQSSAFDESMAKVYDVPLPVVTPVKDPAALARGKRLVESVGACAAAEGCHGANMAGSDKPIEFGPLATVCSPNLTTILPTYSDGQLARLIHHGITKEGKGVLFMPVQDFGWLPSADVDAMIAYLRTIPKVEHATCTSKVSILGKVMDRRNALEFDVARRIDHQKQEQPPAPAPTKEYGAFIARGCTGCHGEHFSGGPLPGAPPDLPTPLNLTPDTTGLKGWEYADFERLLNTGMRKNGQKLNPFMPYEAYSKYDETEKRALWTYLQSVPPRPFGQR